MQCILVNTDVSEEPDIFNSRAEHKLSATHNVKAPISSIGWFGKLC